VAKVLVSENRTAAYVEIREERKRKKPAFAALLGKIMSRFGKEVGVGGGPRQPGKIISLTIFYYFNFFGRPNQRLPYHRVNRRSDEAASPSLTTWTAHNRKPAFGVLSTNRRLNIAFCLRS